MLLNFLKFIFPYFIWTAKIIKNFHKKVFYIEKLCIFAPAFRIGMMSSGVMAALQILVLPVKVRILARQH